MDVTELAPVTRADEPAERVAAGSRPFSIVRIREQGFADFRHKIATINGNRDQAATVEIGAFSVEIQRPPGMGYNVENLGKRGAIEGLSFSAARNLRRFVSGHIVPETEGLAGTFTTRKNWSHKGYKRLQLKFARGLRTFGVAGTYRVQTQKRGAPHCHATLWLPRGLETAVIRGLWLDCTGEASDLMAQRHAVVLKPLEDEGWLLYQAKHDSRECEHQNHYKGKAWGIWNRSLFVKRPLLWSGKMTPEQTQRFTKYLSLFARSQKFGAMRRKREVEEIAVPSGPCVAENVPCLGKHKRPEMELILRPCRSGEPSNCSLIRDPLTRPKLRRKHGGNLFELVAGPAIERLALAVVQGDFRRITSDPF